MKKMLKKYEQHDLSNGSTKIIVDYKIDQYKTQNAVSLKDKSLAYFKFTQLIKKEDIDYISASYLKDFKENLDLNIKELRVLKKEIKETGVAKDKRPKKRLMKGEKIGPIMMVVNKKALKNILRIYELNNHTEDVYSDYIYSRSYNHVAQGFNQEVADRDFISKASLITNKTFSPPLCLIILRILKLI